MQSNTRPSLRRLVAASMFAAALSAPIAVAQDNILIYGHSLIDGPTVGFLTDLVVESGAPAPNVVEFIINDGSTSDYVANQGLITTSLAAGQTWRAMIVVGGTLETTDYVSPMYSGNPALFHANMLTLAATLFGHSPQALFVGHETGADHPSSTRYPSWFADPATWLGFAQVGYAAAQEAITAAHPTSPPARIAHQGTCFASTAGYPVGLYTNDDHHFRPMGEALCACLYFVEIYGGRIEDLGVDYSVSTPLVARLMANNIDENRWNRIVGFVDRCQPRGARPFPGSDSDFQLRVGVNGSSVDLRTRKVATAGDTLRVRLFSPLHATDLDPAGVFYQLLPTGVQPTAGAVPGLHLDDTLYGTYLSVADLTGPDGLRPVPAGLAGSTLWLQASSRAPSGTTGFPLVLSDAQFVDIQ